MADNGGLRLELADGVNVVIRDLLDALVGEDLRIFLGLLDGVRVIGPARRERRVALLFEKRAPVVPAAREEPQAVDEHDRLLPLRVGVVDFLLFMDRENCHLVLLWVCLLGQSVRLSLSMFLGALAWLMRAESRTPHAARPWPGRLLRVLPRCVPGHST